MRLSTTSFFQFFESEQPHSLRMGSLRAQRANTPVRRQQPAAVQRRSLFFLFIIFLSFFFFLLFSSSGHTSSANTWVAPGARPRWPIIGSWANNLSVLLSLFFFFFFFSIYHHHHHHPLFLSFIQPSSYLRQSATALSFFLSLFLSFFLSVCLFLSWLAFLAGLARCLAGWRLILHTEEKRSVVWGKPTTDKAKTKQTKN